MLSTEICSWFQFWKCSHWKSVRYISSTFVLMTPGNHYYPCWKWSPRLTRFYSKLLCWILMADFTALPMAIVRDSNDKHGWNNRSEGFRRGVKCEGLCRSAIAVLDPSAFFPQQVCGPIRRRSLLRSSDGVDRYVRTGCESRRNYCARRICVGRVFAKSVAISQRFLRR